MDYKKIYNTLCDIGKIRNKKEDRYIEKHHIIPKCIGGNNDPLNITPLTYREHFLAHWLLCKIYKNNSAINYSFLCMLRKQPTGERILTSKMYETIKRNFSKFKKWHITQIENPGKTEKSRFSARKRMIERNPIKLSPEKNHTAQPIRVHFMDGSYKDYDYAKRFCLETSISYANMKYWLCNNTGSKKYGISRIERLNKFIHKKGNHE